MVLNERAPFSYFCHASDPDSLTLLLNTCYSTNPKPELGTYPIHTHSYICLITSRCRCLIVFGKQPGVFELCKLCHWSQTSFSSLSYLPHLSARCGTYMHTHTRRARHRGEVSAVFLNPAFLLHMLVYVVVFFFCSHTPKRWISFAPAMRTPGARRKKPPTKNNKRIKQK